MHWLFLGFFFIICIIVIKKIWAKESISTKDCEQVKIFNQLDEHRHNISLVTRHGIRLSKNESIKRQWANVDAYVVKTVTVENYNQRSQSYVALGTVFFGSKNSVMINKRINKYSHELVPLDKNGFLYETGHRIIYKGKAYNKSFYNQFVSDSFLDEENKTLVLNPKNGQTLYFDLKNSKLEIIQP